MKKKCTKCGVEKLLSQFHKSKKNKDGLHYWCKQCNSQQAIKYAEKNKKRVQENKSRWYQENKKRLNEKSRKYIKQKYHDDLNFKIQQWTRKAFRKWFKGTKDKSNSKHLKHINYTLTELEEHLASQFTLKMNWKNYGTYWNIDHIIPVCEFDHTDDEQIKECWKLENLQPLTILENARKSHKRKK